MCETLFFHLLTVEKYIFTETAGVVDFLPAASHEFDLWQDVSYRIAGTIEQPTVRLTDSGQFSDFAVIVISHDMAGHYDIKGVVGKGELLQKTVQNPDISDVFAFDPIAHKFTECADGLARIDSLGLFGGSEGQTPGTSPHVQHELSRQISELK